jgi:hypothetical protein
MPYPAQVNWKQYLPYHAISVPVLYSGTSILKAVPYSTVSFSDVRLVYALQVYRQVDRSVIFFGVEVNR